MTDRPKSIRALRDRRLLEIDWPEGPLQCVPFKTLRGSCPCAGCVDELTGIRMIDVEAIPDDIIPTKIDFCGNYALKIEWSDGHSTGLYTWQRLAQMRGDPL